MNHRLLSLVAFSALAVACGGSAPPPETPPAAPEPPPAEPAPAAEAPPAEAPAAPAAEAPKSNPFQDQVAAGQALYGKHCAECHGPSGNDGKAPPVVGLDKGALPLDPPKKSKSRKTQFKTVGDVADYVVKNMPPKTPGSLTADEYFAILAFDLHANGIDLDKKLDGPLAASLEIPRKK
ncbi:MAG TPA: c-type cytochrome [Polyangiaceae bacterium]